MADKQIVLIFVDKNRLWAYSNITKQIVNLEFPTTIVKDMEVLNHELFIKQFESFLSVHNLAGSQVSIVLSAALLFVKDFSGIEEEKKEEVIKGFVENVPFDSIARTTIHLDKVTRVVVANKDLIGLLKNSLEKLSCIVVAALPSIVMPNNILANGLTLQNAEIVLNQTDALRAYNLLEPEPVLSPLQNITANAADKKHPKRLPLMLGLFGGLTSILIGVIVVTNSQPTIPRSNASVPIVVQPQVLPKPTVVASPSATLQSLRVDLVRTDQGVSKSSQLLTLLKNNGIVDLREVVDNASVGTSVEIIFNQSVPVQLQEQLVGLIKSMEPTISTKVVAGLARDVEIRLK